MTTKTRIFISYSRRDKAFTEKLFHRLKELGYDPWVDWDDIPFSVDWWQEICDAIDAQDVVLNMVSNHSVISRVCTAEITYAREQNKRIIPVIVDKVDIKYVVGELYDQPWEMNARENWDYTRKLNWVYAYREEDDFEQVIQSIISAVETDHYHLRMHTNLLNRAKQWQDNNEGHGFLLMGEELDDAETWLNGITEAKEPQPLDIHRRYIEISRDVQDDQRERYEQMRRQTVRLQRASLLFTLTAVIVIGAILFALRQQQQRSDALVEESEALQSQFENILLRSTQAIETQIAVGEEVSATQSAIIAESTASAEIQQTLVANIDLRLQQAEALRLAVEAQSQLDNGDENLLALPLALAAQRVVGDSVPPVQIQRILSLVAYRPGLVRFFIAENRDMAHTNEITSVAITPDDTRIISGSLDRLVRIWDKQSGDLLLTISGHDARITSLAVHPNGEHVAVGDAEGKIIVWDVRSGEEILRMADTHGGRVTVLAYSLDGNNLTSGSSDTNVIVWDNETGSRLRTLGAHNNRITALAYNPDGETFISGDAQGQLYIWEANTSFWQRRELRHALAITDIAFNESGSQFVTTSLDGSFIHWVDVDADQRRIFSTFDVNDNGLTGVTFVSASRVLLGDQTGQLYEWDLTGNDDISSLVETYTLPTQSTVMNTLAIDADHQQVVAGYANNRLALWSVEHGAVIRRQNVHDFPVQESAMRTDGRLTLRDANGTIYIWNMNDGVVQEMSESELGITGTVLMPNGAHVFAMQDGVPVVYDLDAQAVVQTYPDLNITTNNTVFSPDGQIALSTQNTGDNLAGALGDVNTSTRVLWSVATGDILLTPNNAASLFTFNADGSHLAFLDNFGVLNVVDVATGDTLNTFELDGTVTAMAYSPVNDMLAVGYNDGSFTTLIDNGTEWRTLSGHGGAVRHIVMRPDGERALTVGADNVALVWDTNSEQVLRIFDTRSRGLARGAFDPDGKRVVTLSSDGTAIYWDVANNDDLIAWAEANRFQPTLSNTDCRTFQIPAPCGS